MARRVVWRDEQELGDGGIAWAWIADQYAEIYYSFSGRHWVVTLWTRNPRGVWKARAKGLPSAKARVERLARVCGGGRG